MHKFINLGVGEYVMSKLTTKQQAFSDYYIETGNASESAVKAGYSKKTARSIGQENLTKPAIKAYIDKKLTEIADKRIMKAQEALELLTSIARGEMTEEVVIPLMDDFDKVEKKPDIKDRQKALESILKRYNVSKNEDLKDEMLKAQIEKLKAEAENLSNNNNDQAPPNINIISLERNDEQDN